MDFKIDTRDTFSVITPVSKHISANLSDELRITIQKMRQSGSQNFIINLEHGENIEAEAIEGLVQLHEESYSMGKSLVFTGVKGEILAALKENETDEVINLAPKMIEAIDIISMELLERDLFEEEG
jgi:anti-anti-sigma regulatory factor